MDIESNSISIETQKCDIESIVPRLTHEKEFEPLRRQCFFEEECLAVGIFFIIELVHSLGVKAVLGTNPL